MGLRLGWTGCGFLSEGIVLFDVISLQQRWMENCRQTLTMRLNCSCSPAKNQQNPSASKAAEYVDLNPLYQKFGQTLEVELQKQSQSYVGQIDQLNAEVFALRNTVQRLEIRNKKDSEAEKELRREYNILLAKLKERQAMRQSPEVKVVERVKEVRVEVVDHQMPLELAHWKKKYEEVNELNTRVRIEKEALERNNEDLKDEIQRLRKVIDGLRDQLASNKKNEASKDQTIQRLQSQITYLKSNKQVVIETKHIFPDFKPVQRSRPQTKIETVYIEKPIQKLVLVQVEKRIKEFIQPERPLVNRIISCQPKSDCRCKDQEIVHSNRDREVEHLSEVVERLEYNIKQYRNQREKLVGIIQDKNRELNSLQTQIRLQGMQGRSQYNRGPSVVNVTVTKLSDQKPTSQKISREAEPTRTTQNKLRR